MRWRGVAAIGLAMATPVVAQGFGSDSYTFLKAVRERDGNKATELLDKPTASTLIGARDRDTGEGVLHIVTRRRDLTWMNFMLSKGAPVNARDDDGMTPLMVAAQLGWLEGVQALLQAGAGADIGNSRGETPLILATQARSLPVVTQLLAQGADPHKTDNVAGMSAIDYATRDGRSPAVLRALQEAKTKPKKPVAGPQIGG